MVRWPIKILRPLLNLANVCKNVLLEFSFCLSPNVFISGFNLIAVSFFCPLDATMVVKEAKILQNFSEIPLHVMKDLILVLIGLVSKYLT